MYGDRREGGRYTCMVTGGRVKLCMVSGGRVKLCMVSGGCMGECLTGTGGTYIICYILF
jgi:hypothetical protein